MKLEENNYLKGANELEALTQSVITGVPIGQRRRLQRIAAKEFIAEAYTLNADREYIYGALDVALKLKLITRREWQNSFK